jgi:hypothetical protein
VQAPPIASFGLHHEVHVRMLLMGVKSEHVSVVQREPLAGELLRGGQDLVGRRRRRHRKHDVVHQLDTRTGGAIKSGPVLTGREIEMPVLEQILVLRLGYPLALVGLEFDLALVADVGKVIGDCADPTTAARHFDHNLGRTVDRAVDLRDLGDAESPVKSGASRGVTQKLQERRAVGGKANHAPSHCGSPSR